MLSEFNLVETNARAVRQGDQYGRLTVLATGQIPRTYRYKAVCRCRCGTIKAIRFDHLLKGVTTSCGCFQRDQILKHGLVQKGRTYYDRWKNMMDRCYNPGCASWPNYGGRGIKVCLEWHDPARYFADLPPGFFPGAELDRIDNDGHYEPGNIRWVTHQESANNRRSNRLLTYKGRTQPLTKWAQEMGIDRGTLWERVSVLSWSVEKALETPPIGRSENMIRAQSVRWKDHIKKPKPKPRVLKRFLFQGKRATVREISEITGISINLLRKRLCERGWSVEKATRE